MIRAQRDAGINVRYMVAGEFGERFGRVHWHCILFWRGSDLPKVEIERRINWDFWPHGYSYFQAPDYGGMAYALKYAVKDARPGTLNPFQLSKKPPIGHDFFVEMAKDLADKGLPLHDPSYSFADVRHKGKPRQFWLQGRMREIYVKTYLGQWALRKFLGEVGDVPRTEWLFGDGSTGSGYFYKLYPELTYESLLYRQQVENIEGNQRLSRNVDRKRLGGLRSNQDMINRAEKGL
nr:MAG: replication initiator protein [Microvirus sp.]